MVRSSRTEESMNSKSLLPVVTTLLAHALVWALAIHLWPTLPERLPMKFDLAGNPTRWVEAEGGDWFALPALATLITTWLLALGPGIRFLARQNPEWINVPSKERFLEASPAARVDAMRPIIDALRWMATLINLLFAWILLGMERVGSNLWTKLPPWPLFVFLALLAAVLVPGILGTTRLVREGRAE